MWNYSETADYSSNTDIFFSNGGQHFVHHAWWMILHVCDAFSNADINYYPPSLSLCLQLSSRREKWGWMTSSRSWCLPHISANSEYSHLKCYSMKGQNVGLGWKIGTRSISWHHLLPGSSIYFWSLADSWSACVGQSNQPPQFGRTFCEKHNLGPRGRGNKNSPFMTSLLTTSPLPNHLSCKSLLSPRRG